MNREELSERRFPYDRETTEILSLIRDKERIPSKGVVKVILESCPAWSYYKDKDYRGANISIGRRLRRMENNFLIRKVKLDEVEYWELLRGF